MYHHDEDLCNAAIQNDGTRCHFDKSTDRCEVVKESPPPSCEKLSADQYRANKYCLYEDATTSCNAADPALAGKCEIIQVEDACTKDPTCRWNAQAVVCQDRD